MKHFPLFLLLAVSLSILTSCLDNSVEDKYKDRRNANLAWFEEQRSLTVDGKTFYTEVTAPWDPSGVILMHWFNDTMLTKDNLKPLYTSTVDVIYRGVIYDGTPFDSSYLNTSPGDSIFRTTVNSVVEGWSLALTNMHVGDSCRIVVPYTMGYGSYDMGTILQPYSMLQFDLKLVDIYAYKTNQ